MTVDRNRAVAVIEERIARPLGLSVEEAAHGILRIATANMSRAIRAVSTEHGHDPSDFVLFAFGGAGPLHAAEVAQECGISSVLVPHEPGTLCARGILLADISRDFVRTQLAILSEDRWRAVGRVMEEMLREGEAWLAQERVPQADRRFHLHIDARYRGQTHDIRVQVNAVEQADQARFIEAFHQAHRAQYGHDNPGLAIEIVTCRVQAVGLVAKDMVRSPPVSGTVPQWNERQIYFGSSHGWIATRVYRRDSLSVGTELSGPVVIEEMSSTTVVLPGQQAVVDRFGNIRIQS
jgi:N-methylhydantoinase A